MRSGPDIASRQTGMTLVEVLVALGFLGVAMVVLMQGQEFVKQMSLAHDQKVTLWSVERQFQAQLYGRVRDVLLRSFDEANKCEPCVSSLGSYPGLPDGRSCEPIPLALDDALAAFDGNVRLYSTQLSVVSTEDPLPKTLGKESGAVADAYKRCRASGFTALAGLTSAKSIYTCLHVRSALEKNQASGLMADKSGKDKGKGDEKAPPLSDDKEPKRDLDLFFENRVLFAEVSVGLQDNARGKPLTCKEFAKAEPGNRGVKLHYVVYAINEKATSDLERYVQLRGSFTARLDK